MRVLWEPIAITLTNVLLLTLSDRAMETLWRVVRRDESGWGRLFQTIERAGIGAGRY